MEIKNILGKDKVTLSFEVFPPKQTSNSMEVEKAAYGVAELKPSYMSVTYGAGGSTRSNTLRIAQKIQDTYGITTIAHLTCVGATKESITSALKDLREAGVSNILALMLYNQTNTS